ncbi:hypothetical protein HKD37_19G054797 [Glycine soja]|nr:hypothetical protein GmHk_19G056133 [Glycine max]
MAKDCSEALLELDERFSFPNFEPATNPHLCKSLTTTAYQQTPSNNRPRNRRTQNCNVFVAQPYNSSCVTSLRDQGSKPSSRFTQRDCPKNRRTQNRRTKITMSSSHHHMIATASHHFGIKGRRPPQGSHSAIGATIFANPNT